MDLADQTTPEVLSVETSHHVVQLGDAAGSVDEMMSSALEPIAHLDFDPRPPCEWDDRHPGQNPDAVDYWLTHCRTFAYCRGCSDHTRDIQSRTTKRLRCLSCGAGGLDASVVRYLGPVR